MKKLVLTTAMLAAFVGYNGAAHAITLDDPLHSAVCSGAGTGCVNTDTGSFAPLGQFVNWGFTISGVQGGGGASGDLTLAILVPSNQINVTTFTLPTLTDNGGGPLSELVGSRTTLLTSANGSSLAAYLQGQSLLGPGSYSPTDNFSNASAGEATENPGFTGAFLAFSVTIPGIFIDAQGGTTLTNDFSFGSNVPAGTVIVGFFNEANCSNNCLVGTAASEDLVVTPFSTVPAPLAGAGLVPMLLGGFTMLGIARRRITKRLGLNWFA